MPRYYFNIEDGRLSPDGEGTELVDLAKARSEALRMSGEILREGGEGFWSGSPWKLWVTDEPNGAGTTLFTLRFSAVDGA